MTPSDRMQATAECRDLSVAFANHMDARRYDKLAALFAPEGVFERAGKPVVGPAAIQAEMAKRPADMVTLHVCTNILVEPTDADHATGETYYLVVKHDNAAGKGPFPLTGLETVGVFYDKYVRTGAGWRIAERKATRVFAK